MNKIILENGRYFYYPNYNKLINSEFENLFYRFGMDHEVFFEQEYFDLEILQNKLKKIRQIIFQVTQDCNLRCNYCCYSGKYSFRRSHSKKTMVFEVAKEGIDQIYNLIKHRQQKKFSIGFYGGEPILNFHLVKKIVTYSLKKFSGFELTFFLTTNGTILNNDCIEFLIEKKFILSISLDGSEKTHDQHRVFKNGSGTHKIVMDNLHKIKSLSSDFFFSNVKLIATFPANIDIRDTYDFFTNSSIINDLDLSVGQVDWRDTSFYDGDIIGENYRDETIQFLFPKVKHKLRKKIPLNPIEKSLLKPYTRIAEELDSKHLLYTSGTCIFNSRVFLDCDGLFHICERISSNTPIGNIHDGFDLKKMHKILHDFCELIRTSCATCVARAFCRICFSNVEQNGKFKLDNIWCQKQKSLLRKRLSEYIELRKEGFSR